jgi:hypothetical protein
MSDGAPRLTEQQESFIAEVGADPDAALASLAPGCVFVYVELPTRTIRHEIDEAGRVVQTDIFMRPPRRVNGNGPEGA